jgi:methyl-accepting chemotaxis protein
MTLKEEITKAIGAHGMWKARLRTAIDTGKSDTNVTDAGKDNGSAFGQWLYGPTIEAAAKGGGDFKEVQKLHAEFHKAAAQVLQLALQGKKTEAEKLLAHGSFADVSAQLTSAMMRWQKSVA